MASTPENIWFYMSMNWSAFFKWVCVVVDDGGKEGEAGTVCHRAYGRTYIDR